MEHFCDLIDGYSDLYDQGILIKKILEILGNKKINFAEIGVYKGKSTSIFNVELINSGIEYEYHAIDHFMGSDEHDSNIDYYSITLENLSPILDKIQIIKNDSIEQSKQYEDSYFDVVYIDASHDYESVKKDIIHWLPKVKSGGIICGDDYVEGWPDVIQAVNEILGDISVIGNQQWLKIKE